MAVLRPPGEQLTYRTSGIHRLFAVTLVLERTRRAAVSITAPAD
jgi:hypothetical protein